MKNFIRIIFILLFAFGCKEPAPTELINNSLEDFVQINPISTDVDENLNIAGYDSTGITNPFMNKSTIVSITGVRNTNYGNLQSEGYYYAVFNDKAKPVKVKNGKMIGFKSKSYFSVRFNNYEAMQVPNIVKYREGGIIKDTVLGIKYFVKHRMMGHFGQMQGFPFSSKIDFKVYESGNSFVQFDISTPAEILGKVSLDVNRAGKSQSLILEWNALKDDNVEIILAEWEQANNNTEPLLKIEGNKNGKVKIPLSIIENVLRTQKKIIVISFIRKIIREINNNLLDDTYIVAQSIHNIRIQIP